MSILNYKHEEGRSLMPYFEVKKIGEIHRGKNYGQWIASWWNWLMSDSPDMYDGGDMLFLRGNVGGGYVLEKISQEIKDPIAVSTNLFDDPRVFYNRTGDNAITVYKGTAIFLSVLDSCFAINDSYNGKQLLTEQDLRLACFEDMRESKFMFATIGKINAQGNITNVQPIAPNLLEYVSESPMFNLVVSSGSPLAKSA